MLSQIDGFLNKTTMYRLVLYVLIFDIGFGLIAAITGNVPYTFYQVLVSTLVLVISSQFINFLVAKFLKAETNQESALITALILSLVLSPATKSSEILLLVFACLLANTSKYLISLNKKHLINPAAFACLALGLMGFGNVSWWIGSSIFLPVSLISGLLVTRKIRREGMVLVFFASSLITLSLFAWKNNYDLYDLYRTMIFSGPLIFFATVMFTEPLTTPPRNKTQYIYAVIVGLLFGSSFQVGPLYSTPELSLVIGNLFGFFLGSKKNFTLTLISKKILTKDIVDLEFTADKKINFLPGQYLEWTMSHSNIDSRGNRRFFTIASSPTEKNIRLVMRFDPVLTSSFKKALISTELNTTIAVSQPMGDFVLPENRGDKLVFVAGGVGITPFLSMIRYLLDRNETRDINLIYIVKTYDDLIYEPLLEDAEKIGVKTTLVLTETQKAPRGWSGLRGRIDGNKLIQIVPDIRERRVFISGPTGLVDSIKVITREAGVPKNQIVTDYFPGF